MLVQYEYIIEKGNRNRIFEEIKKFTGLEIDKGYSNDVIKSNDKGINKDQII